jgi:hypothetical protein
MSNQELIDKIPFNRLGKLDTRILTDDVFKEVCKRTDFIMDLSKSSISQRVYCLKNNIFEIPKCKECDNIVKWQKTKFALYCSNKCVGLSIEVKQKKIETCFKNFGVAHPGQSQEVKDKAKVSCLEKYGVEFAFQAEEVKEKIKYTTLERYGVDNFAKSEECKALYKFTCQERYGVDNTSQTQDVKNKIKDTNFERYGVENTFQTKQTEISMLERYGVRFPLQYHVFKEKSKLTSLENWGVEYPSQSKEISDKIAITMANRFQLRKNEEGTDYCGVVYILHFPQHKAIKIGITGNFKQRSKNLIKDFGTFSIIEMIETDYCYSLESKLHEKFSTQRVCLQEGNGRTEFFKEEIMTQCQIK